MFDVFISYSSKDRQAAFAACAILESRGITCWIAPRNIPPGTTWAEAIMEAMRESRIMVLIFSAHANESEQIKREVERAVARGMPIIPVRLESVLPQKALEYFISAAHWLDAFPPPFETYLETLVGAVQALLDGKPPVETPGAPPRTRAGARTGTWLIAGLAAVAIAMTATAVLLKETAGPGRNVIETFAVPAKFADATGMDGAVVAEHMLDQMNARETGADVYSMRAPDRFAASAGTQPLLKNPFRHDVRIGGDIVNSGHGWVLTVRIAGAGAQAFPILHDDVEAAVGQAADWAFQQIAPDRYAVILGLRTHVDQEALFLQLARSPQNPDHLWIASKLSELYFARGQYRQACDVAEEAHAEDASFVPIALDLANCRFGMGQLGETLALVKASAERLASSPPADIAPKAVADLLPQLNSRLAEFAGAWTDAADIRGPVRHSTVNYLNKKMPPWDASNHALAHDPGRAVAIMKDAGMGIGGEAGGVEDGKALRQFQSIGFAPSNFFVAAAQERWADAAADLSVADKTATGFGNVNEIRQRYVWPWLAYALARSGKMAEGRALADKAPLDCYVCLQMRGRIAALERKFDQAADWYQKAIASADALPFAYADWAAALWAQGDAAGAIAKLEEAQERAPRNADVPELWGEILVATNRSDLALDKFAQAARFAPQWGRLRLKWGEALLWLGRRGEAQSQFDTAARLALAPADLATLQRLSAQRGSRATR